MAAQSTPLVALERPRRHLRVAVDRLWVGPRGLVVVEDVGKPRLLPGVHALQYRGLERWRRRRSDLVRPSLAGSYLLQNRPSPQHVRGGCARVVAHSCWLSVGGRPCLRCGANVHIHISISESSKVLGRMIAMIFAVGLALLHT